ncbi:MAG: anhydro-N-acetylmuramic acid kinase [Sulfurimonas sp.]|nr:anhydro-N-acetylmuramic acid kinase [Sulfurimonas sp.]MDQ7060074.1 anhydro-N-acetylmuramic acid kinase [Sulfurimonas sp.]
MTELYIGVMSGTSLDGVDVTLCKIDDTTCKLIYALEYPLDADLKEEILSTISGQTTLASIGILNTKLANLFADAINALLGKYTIDASTVKAIGLHGQTLWHEPQGDFPFSIQLGCPNIVSAQTNIQVVADFRSMDIANGGQGAPFAPAFHEFLFKQETKKIALINIGGMANITILDAKIKGWDTGPGNVLLDYWVHTCKNLPYDPDGTFAASGKINKSLLVSFLNDDYFKKAPPKSTGREYFNASWLSSHLALFDIINKEDIQRTLLELTAITIANDVKSKASEVLIVCGGGVKNTFLIRRLRELNTCSLATSDDYGVSSDYMESMAFAWFAKKRLDKEVVNLKSVTGASKNSILGGIYG